MTEFKPPERIYVSKSQIPIIELFPTSAIAAYLKPIDNDQNKGIAYVPEPRWIPVSEGLPKKHDFYLVTMCKNRNAHMWPHPLQSFLSYVEFWPKSLARLNGEFGFYDIDGEWIRYTECKGQWVIGWLENPELMPLPAGPEVEG